MDLYDIIFKGEVMPGLSTDQVRANLAQLFSVPLQQLDALFNNQPHMLKSGLALADAERYHETLKRAGAISYRRRSGAQRAAVQSTGPRSGLSLAPRHGNLLRDDERNPVCVQSIDISHLQLAPKDSGPLAESKPAPPPPPNTDHLHLL